MARALLLCWTDPGVPECLARDEPEWLMELRDGYVDGVLVAVIREALRLDCGLFFVGLVGLCEAFDIFWIWASGSVPREIGHAKTFMTGRVFFLATMAHRMLLTYLSCDSLPESGFFWRRRQCNLRVLP